MESVPSYIQDLLKRHARINRIRYSGLLNSTTIKEPISYETAAKILEVAEKLDPFDVDRERYLPLLQTNRKEPLDYEVAAEKLARRRVIRTIEDRISLNQ